MKKTFLSNLKKIPVNGIGILLLFLGVVLFLIYFFTRSTETIEVRMFLTEREWAKTWDNYPDYFYLENLSTDLIEKDELGRTVARIIEIHSNRLPFTHNRALAKIQLKANYNKNTGVYSFQGKPMIIGDYQRLRIGNMRVQGYLLDIGKELEPIETHEIVIKVIVDDEFEANRNLTNSRAIGINVDTSKFLEVGRTISNFQNEPILEIIEVNLQPGQRTIFDNTGSSRVRDETIVSGEMILKLKVNTINGIRYWNFVEPVQIGRRLEIPFEGAVVPIKIIQILDGTNYSNE
jgi:hypothetical protein